MIDIRIVGRANMADVKKEMAGATAAVQAFRAEAQRSTQALMNSGHPNAQNDAAKNFRLYAASALEVARNTRDTIKAQGDFEVSTRKVADGYDKMVDSIHKNKFALRDLIKDWDKVKDLYNQQYSLQRSVATRIGTSPGGNGIFDIYTPKNLEEAGSAVDKFRARLGHMNAVMTSVNENLINTGKNVQWSGRQLMAGFTYPLAIAAGVSAKMAYDIDKGLTQIVKVYGDTGDAVRETDEQIKKSAMTTVNFLSKTYGQSAKETLEIQSQLASTGVVGIELQQKTKEVSRAMLLGDLNVQDAMKATITLQEVYQMNNEKLAETFNYMNMMENETNLTMQDFVEGVPKVAGIMKALNADVQDTGFLLAGLKAAGIDAKEGGTALKSMVFKDVAPSGKAVKQFASLTGQSLEQIVKATEGKPVETLQKIGLAIKDLSETDQIKVMSSVFGIHQGSKATGLIKMLTEMNGQMDRAYQISKKMGPNEWAETAAGELERLKAADWVKIQSSIEVVKNAMAEFGREVLTAAAPALESIGNSITKFSEWFGGLSDGTKKFALWTVALIGITGPLIMITGLFLNLSGQVSKFVKNVLTPFSIKQELLTKKQMAEKLALEQTTAAVLKKASAYRQLNDAIQGQTTAEHSRRLFSQVPVPVAQQPVEKKGPRRAYSPGGPVGDARVYSVPTEALRTAASKSEEIANGARKTSLDWEKISHNAGLLTMAAGAMGTMVGHSDSTLNNISNAVFMAGLLGPAIAKGIAKAKVKERIVGAVAAASNWATMPGTRRAAAGSKAVSTLSKAGPAIKTLGATIAGLAGPIGIATLAVGGLFYMIHKKNKEAIAAQEALNDSHKTYAKMIGATLREEAEFDVKKKNTVDQYKAMAEEAKSANQDLKKASDDMKKSLEGLSRDDRIARIKSFAVAEGMRARVAGATAEEAREIARLTATQIDESLAEEWPLRISAGVFVEIEDVNVGQVDSVRRRIKDAMEAGQVFNGDYMSFTIEDEEAIKTSVQDAFNVFQTLSGEEAQKMYQKMGTDLYEGMNTAYDAMSKGQKDALEKHGVADGRTLAKYVGRVGPQGLIDMLSEEGQAMDAKTKVIFGSASQSVRIALGQYADAMKLSDEEKEQIVNSYNIDSLLGQSAFSTKGIEKVVASTEEARIAQKHYTAELARRRAAGEELTVAQKNEIASNYTMQLGWGRAVHANDELIKSVSLSTDHIKKNTYAKRENANAPIPKPPDLTSEMFGMEDIIISDMEATEVTDMLRSQWQGVQSEMFDLYSKQMNQLHDSRVEAIEAEGKAALNTLDREAEAREAVFEKRAKGVEAKFERRERNFQARWEKRRDEFEASWDKTMDRFDKNAEREEARVEGIYDKRIDAIDKAIEAEKKAEDVRQKIFEKEKARIAHLADMANRSIDINMAINSGDLDEAAKLSNDAQAAIDTFNLDDAGEISKSGSDKRIAGLEAKRTVEEKRKDRALAALKERQEAEKKDLEHRKKLAERALRVEEDKQKRILENQRASALAMVENDRKAYAKLVENQRRSIQASTDAKVRSEKRQFEVAEDRMRKEMDTLRAFIPQNRQQMKGQIAGLEKEMGGYGYRLKKSGGEWSKSINSSLVYQTRKASAQVQNDIAWGSIGKRIADEMSKGISGMTFRNFMKWAENPNSSFDDIMKAQKRYATQKETRALRAKGIDMGTIKSKHSGGIIDDSLGSRVGYSGKHQAQSEVFINALKGESVLNRKATSRLGKSGVDALNSGSAFQTHVDRRDPHERGDGPGVAGMAAALSMGMMKAIMTKVVTQKQQQNGMGGMEGIGGATGKFDAFWKALAKQESGGNYRAVNSMTGALGKYQVLPSNVAPWARQYLNRSMTPQQFLNSPALQDELVRAVLGSYYDKWGPRGAAAAWYAGPANHNLHMSTRPQPGGPSIKGYVDSIINMMNQMLSYSGSAAGGAAYAGMGYERMWQIVKKRFPSRQRPSPNQFNQGGHAKNSYHYQGRAVDFGSAKDSVPLSTLFNFLYTNYGRQSKELIYGPMAHKNIKNGRHLNYGPATNSAHWYHVHWAMRNGGLVPGNGFGDKTPIVGEPGEFMMKKKAVDHLGVDTLKLLNSDRFINMPSPALSASGVQGNAAASIDKSYNPSYTVQIDARGATDPDAIEGAVYKALYDIEKKAGFKRRIGGD